ncbi:hypothetical protein ACOJQI_02645 [Bacillus salacetis]|uniref:DUF3108 domain-containing protein n=1 Tax=Bacillus salacetis TaxID=2315464 RepID=UPI003B9FD787
MIKTGDRTIDWTSFKSCSDKKDVVLIEDGEIKVLGSTIEEVFVDKENDVLHRVQRLLFNDPEKGTRTVNLHIKASTFEPLSCTDTGNENVSVHYGVNGIEVSSDEEGGEIQRTYEREEGIFDLFSVELLLRLLPLETGYTCKLIAFSLMAKERITVEIEVVGLESISDGIKEIAAWQVNVHFGEMLQKYWIGKETKELLKQSIQLDDKVFFDFVR